MASRLASVRTVHRSRPSRIRTGAFSYVDLDGNLLLAEDVAETEYGPCVEIDGPGHGIVPEL